MTLASFLRAAWFALSAAILHPALAQQPNVGDAAPPLDLAGWLNVEAGKEPKLEALKGSVVMLEFWGTWCGPCVRAMPEVQKLHDRYRDRGLVVLAISYETAEKMQPFLKENSYTMPVGSDPEKKVVQAYAIKSWPTTYVIGKDGKIARIGSPYDAESAVEKALGLETSAAVLLTAWLDAQKADKDKQREAMTRLLEKAPPDFDLQVWARANGGAETAVAGPGGADAGKPADAAARGPTVDGADLLRKTAAAWNDKDSKKRVDLVQKLAASGLTAFDLCTFVRAAYGKAFPLDSKELQTMLTGQKFGDALQAIVTRNPAPAVVGLAVKDARLKDWCRTKAPEARAMARKAIMVQRWTFAGAQPKDIDGFWKDLAVSGVAMSPDKKQITGVLLGGAQVERAKVEGFIQDQLGQSLAMEALIAGKAPGADLPQQVAKERAEIVKQLDQRYGAPEKK
jgi:peroxiredoxin